MAKTKRVIIKDVTTGAEVAQIDAERIRQNGPVYEFRKSYGEDLVGVVPINTNLVIFVREEETEE